MSLSNSHAGPSKSALQYHDLDLASPNSFVNGNMSAKPSIRGSWSPETSPSSSETSDTSSSRDQDDHDHNFSGISQDQDDLFLSSSTPSPSPPSSSSYSTMSSAPSILISQSSPTASTSTRATKSSSSSSHTSPTPLIHPYRPNSHSHPRAGVRIPTMTSMPKANLPKSQPLSRALFARIASSENVPHAGLLGPAGKKAGAQGKPKMIVATKPMRTTFELGLTASELARKA